MRNTQRKINTEMGKNKRQANKNELCILFKTDI